MKSILNVTSIILLPALIISSCRKDERMNAIPQSTTLETQNTTTEHRMITVPGNPNYSSAIRLNVAYINTAELLLEGQKIIAEANDKELKEPVYIQAEGKQVDLLAPASGTMMTFPPGKYENVVLRGTVQPQAPVNFSLYMEGAYPLNGSDVPIYIIATIPVKIERSWARISIDGYSAKAGSVKVDITELLKGFEEPFISTLEVNKGSITISATENRNAYDKIVSNLNAAVYIGY